MRSARLMLVAAALAAALLPALGGTAGAQQPAYMLLDGSCDPATGEYLVTAQLVNVTDGSVAITDEAYGASTPGGTIAGAVSFSPNPVGAGGTATATFHIPGDSTEVDVAATVLSQYNVSEEIPLDGDCTPTPTTAVVTTTTAAQAARVVQPSFTG